MNFCKAHWDRLKLAITNRGLGDFVAKDGGEAIRQIEASLADPDTLRLEDFDPLMAANNMIFGQFLQRSSNPFGPDPDTGKPPCPLCEVAKTAEGRDQNWIDGATENAAEMVAELRKGPVDLKKKREEAERRGGSS